MQPQEDKSRHSGQAVDASAAEKPLICPETGHPHDCSCRACERYTCNCHSGQAVDKQEEAAYEKLQIKCQGCGVSWFIEIPSETWWSGALAEANELMNRELTAERQRHPTYETVLEALDILTKAYDERGQPNTLVALAERAAETKQQLLSALAALKRITR